MQTFERSCAPLLTVLAEVLHAWSGCMNDDFFLRPCIVASAIQMVTFEQMAEQQGNPLPRVTASLVEN